MRRYLHLILILLVTSACNSPKEKPQTENETLTKMHKIEVGEVVQTTQYTYLYVNENKKEYWVAIAKQEIEAGEILLYLDASANEMVNFHSKELNRDFPSILFISQVSREKGTAINQHQSMNSHLAMNAQAHMGRKVVPAVQNISVEPVSGGVTIANLYASKAKYAGKKVKVRGNVVKVNDQIMGRNWVHLQDGTKHGDDYDLTCTTQQSVVVGDVVTLEGVIALERDFTSGYFYPVIMEDAIVVK